ncbi:MAG: SDR family NAD(P)-dependent oxidoreductase [Bryobacterales bacterium]|nr:SDR family NAD(P)-dependent oxidoreductase [Bryobacterales bacterium]
MLRDKTIIITGAKGGLGTYVTNSFLEAGARVIGVSRSIEAADFPQQRFSAIAAGVSSGEDARSVIAGALALSSRIDGLVHLIGGFAGGSTVADTDDATFERMMDLNFRSAFLMIRAALPRMRAQGSGRILAIGSKSAAEPSPKAAVYAASKAALVSLIRSVARETRGQGITANIVLPATMDTPANRVADPQADFSKWVDPQQVADLLIHLASDRGSQINGAVIPIYGASA